MGDCLKRVVLLFFVLIILGVPVFGQPPFEDLTNEFASVGLHIEHQPLSVVDVDEWYVVNHHVYNLTNNYEFDNSSVKCDFYLIDSQGRIIYFVENMSTTDTGKNFRVNISSSNFSRAGFYVYHTDCEHLTKDLGGYVSVYFEATADGFAQKSVMPLVWVQLGLVGFLVLFGVLVYFKTFRNANRLKFARYLSFAFLGVALVELVFLVGLLYADYVWADVAGLVGFNLLMLVILGFALLVGAGVFYTISLVDLQDDGEYEVRWEKD